jgi:hypothetical protein
MGKFQAGNRYTNELSKILEEFPPGEEEYPGKSCLGTGTLTDSKGFCENSSLGKGKLQA